MTDLQPTDLHPQSLATAPETPADAVALQARIDAVTRWLDGVKSDLRDWLEGRAAHVEKLTGGAFNVPVSGVGRALMTDPQPKARVADPKVFAEWLAEHGHENMTAETVEVTVTNHRKAAEACDGLTELADDQASVTEFAYQLRDALTADRYLVPTEDALDRLLDDPDEPVQVLDADPYDPWVAYIDDDGEPHEVDGTAVSLASRRLQVRIERGHKDHLDHLVEDAVGPPVLRPGAEA